jgi:hypothetical protein
LVKLLMRTAFSSIAVTDDKPMFQDLSLSAGDSFTSYRAVEVQPQ